MATINLNETNFQDTVAADGTVLVDWWASWCGPCMRFGPIYESVAAKHPDLTFAKVDTEAEQGLAGAAGIQSIPTLMVFRDGILLFSQPGALPESALEDLVSQVGELDMDDIRRQIAAESSSPAASDA